MSRGVNKWIGIGNCCADPEQRALPSGVAVTNITVACNDSYKDKQTGQQVDNTEFVRIVFFNKLAEIAGQYLKKGSKVYVEGKLKTRKYQDKTTGQDRYSTEIVASELQMLDSRQDGQQGQQNNQGFQNNQLPPQQNNQAPQQSSQGFDDNDFNSDIPF